MGDSFSQPVIIVAVEITRAAIIKYVFFILINLNIKGLLFRCAKRTSWNFYSIGFLQRRRFWPNQTKLSNRFAAVNARFDDNFINITYIGNRKCYDYFIFDFIISRRTINEPEMRNNQTHFHPTIINEWKR